MHWLTRLKSFLAGLSRQTPQLPIAPSESRSKSIPEPHASAGHRRVVLYTRSGCHLCDEAKKVLEKCREPFGLSLVEVDIDHDPALQAAYDCCVPVVEIDGRLRFRGHVNEVLLRRLLRGSRG